MLTVFEALPPKQLPNLDFLVPRSSPTLPGKASRLLKKVLRLDLRELR